jgi:hypothetical protein
MIHSAAAEDRTTFYEAYLAEIAGDSKEP